LCAFVWVSLQRLCGVETFWIYVVITGFWISPLARVNWRPPGRLKVIYYDMLFRFHFKNLIGHFRLPLQRKHCVPMCCSPKGKHGSGPRKPQEYGKNDRRNRWRWRWILRVPWVWSLKRPEYTRFNTGSTVNFGLARIHFVRMSCNPGLTLLFVS